MTSGRNRQLPQAPRLRLVSTGPKRAGHFELSERCAEGQPITPVETQLPCKRIRRDHGRDSVRANNRTGGSAARNAHCGSSRFPDFHGPSPHFLAALIGIGLILAMGYFVHWLESQQPPVHVERTGMGVRPNPPECDGTCPLYDCLNRRERCPL